LIINLAKKLTEKKLRRRERGSHSIVPGQNPAGGRVGGCLSEVKGQKFRKHPGNGTADCHRKEEVKQLVGVLKSKRQGVGKIISEIRQQKDSTKVQGTPWAERKVMKVPFGKGGVELARG